MTLPFKAFHESRGARFEDDGAIERLAIYKGLEAEYEALHGACAIFDLSDRGRLEVAGPDRVRFLNSQVSNDLGGLVSGRGIQAAVLNRQSKVQALLWLFAFEDHLLIDLEPGLAGPLAERLAKYRVADRVEFASTRDGHTLFSIQGPKAHETAASALGAPLPALDLGAHVQLHWRGHAVSVLSVPRTSRGGLDLAIPRDAGADLWEAFVQAGAVPAGWLALETGRIEAGLPRYGADVTAEHLLAEAGVPEAVSYSKGCYIGQEVVARVKSRGHVNRLRTGLVSDGPAFPSDPVFDGSQMLGGVTSAAWSPQLGRHLAMAVLRQPAASRPGTACVIRGKDGPVSGVVTSLPFLPENFERLR